MRKPYAIARQGGKEFLLDFKHSKIYTMDREARQLHFIINVYSYLGHNPYILEDIKQEYEQILLNFCLYQ